MEDPLPRLLLLAGLLGLSAFFSGSETVLFSLTPHERDRLQRGKSRGGHLAAQALLYPQTLLATILFGNLLVNVTFFVMASEIALQAASRWAAMGVSLGALGVVILFGEVAPKVLAVKARLRLAPVVSFPVLIFGKLFFPATWVLGKVVTLAMELLGRDRRPERAITSEELDLLLDLSAQQGVIDRNERDMIQETVELGDVRVKEILVPRVDVVMCRASTRQKELIARLRETRRSKIPVYERSRDNIIGLVYAKDVLLHPERPWKEMLRPVKFVPELATVESLLRAFKREGRHVAIAVDEYGGFAGIVTLEDILEEIVGEIDEAHEPEEAEPILQVGPNQFSLAGDLSIRDWKEWFGVEAEDAGFDTLGGFVTLLL